MYIEELMKDFLSQMQESALRKLRGDNEEYIENHKKLLDLREELESFIQGQDDKTRQLLEEYLDTRLLEEAISLDYLYATGFRDAFRVLMYLEKL